MDPRPETALPLANALRGLAQSHDAACWEALVTQVGNEILDLARRILRDDSLADDATQETLLRVRDCAGQFAPDGQTDANTAARRWIMRIACTTALKLLRTRNRAQARDEAYAKSAPSSAQHSQPDPELTARVRQEVEALPERERIPIVCHFFADMPYDQIARQLGCPVGTAKTHVHRGLEKLRGRLALLGILLPVTGIEPALRATATTGATATASQLLKWKALLSAPKAVSTGIGIGGLSFMAKLCLGATAALLAAFAAVTVNRAHSASTSPAPVNPIVPAAPVAVAPVVNAPPAMPQWQTDLRAKLQRKVTFEFVDQSLDDVVNFLGSLHNAEVNVTPAAKKKVEAAKKSVTLRVSELSLERSYRLTAYLLDLEFKFADGRAVLDLPGGALPPAVVPADPTADDLTTLSRLSRRVTFEFQDTSANEALAFFRQISNVVIVYKPDTQPDAGQSNVSYRVTDMSLRNAMFWTGALSGGTSRTDDGIIFWEDAKRDASAVELSRKLNVKYTDALLGTAVPQAIEALGLKAGVKITLSAEAADVIKAKILAAADVPSGVHPAGVLLHHIAASQGLDVKVHGDALTLVPHQPALDEDGIHQSLNSGLPINLIALEDAGTPVLLLTEQNYKAGLTDELKQTILNAGLIYRICNGAIGIGSPVEIWKLEELPPLPANIPDLTTPKSKAPKAADTPSPSPIPPPPAAPKNDF